MVLQFALTAHQLFLVLVFSLPYFAGCAADGVRHRILFGDAETRLAAEMADIVQLLGDGFIVSATARLRIPTAAT